MAQFHVWACEAAQASIALDVPKKAALPCQIRPLLAWFGCLLAIKRGLEKGLVGFSLASGWLSGWTSPCLEKSRTYLAETGWTSPLPGGGLHCPSHKRSKVDGAIPRVGLRSSPGVDRLGPGCLAKSGLSCLASGYQKKRFGWLLAGFWLARTYLAETGWTSTLPGGGLVEALTLPQTKQSRWHNSTRACEAAQASIASDVPKKAALP